MCVCVFYQAESYLGSWVPFSFNREAMCPPFGVHPSGSVNSVYSDVVVASCVVWAGPTLPTLPLSEWEKHYDCYAEKNPPLALLPQWTVAVRESSKYRTKPCYGPVSNPRPPSHNAARYY